MTIQSGYPNNSSRVAVMQSVLNSHEPRSSKFEDIVTRPSVAKTPKGVMDALLSKLEKLKPESSESISVVENELKLLNPYPNYNGREKFPEPMVESAQRVALVDEIIKSEPSPELTKLRDAVSTYLKQEGWTGLNARLMAHTPHTE